MAGEDAKVPDQVHLVVVAGGVCDLGPGLRGCAAHGQGAAEAGDAGESFWRDAGEGECFALEVLAVDSGMARYFPDLVGAAADGGEAMERFVDGIELGRVAELGEEVAIEELASVVEVGKVAEPLPQAGDGGSEDGVAFGAGFGEGRGWDAEEGVEAGGLEHDDERFDMVPNDEAGAAPGLRADDGDGKGGVEGVGAVVSDLVGSGEFKLEHDAETSHDRLGQFAGTQSGFALDVGANEGTKRGEWRRCCNG